MERKALTSMEDSFFSWSITILTSQSFTRRSSERSSLSSNSTLPIETPERFSKASCIALNLKGYIMRGSALSH